MLCTPKLRGGVGCAGLSSVLTANAAAAATAIVDGGVLPIWAPSLSNAIVSVISRGIAPFPAAPAVPLGLLLVLFGSESPVCTLRLPPVLPRSADSMSCCSSRKSKRRGCPAWGRVGDEWLAAVMAVVVPGTLASLGEMGGLAAAEA